MNQVFRAVWKHLGSLSSHFINHAETAYSPDMLPLCKKEDFQYYCTSETTETSAAFSHLTKTEAGSVKTF